MNDDDANRLAEVALDLVQRVRDDDPAANGRWLANTLPSSDDWFQLCFVLAAAVPDDRSWRHLTEWARQLRPAVEELEDDGPRVPATAEVDALLPCGTYAAYVRHRAHGQEPCTPCVEANRSYEREKKQRQREDAA